MILEPLLSITALKIIWELLEITHMIQVGYHSSHIGYHGGSALQTWVAKAYQKRWDNKHPVEASERDAPTLYETLSRKEANTQADAYFQQLSESIKALKEAKTALFNLETQLDHMVTTHYDPTPDQLRRDLLLFRDHFNTFRSAYFTCINFIAYIPPRELLYVASNFDTSNVISTFNNHVITLEENLDIIGNTAESISRKFHDFSAHHPSSQEPTLKTTLELAMEQHTDTSAALAHIINHTQLSQTCAEVIHALSECRHENRSNHAWNTAAWHPLLHAHQQVETIQRILLHAMEENRIDTDKLDLAKMLLRRILPREDLQASELEYASYDWVVMLRTWQLEQCDLLTRCLKQYKADMPFPRDHPTPELISWLKTDRRKQDAVEFLKNRLVKPCLFSHDNHDQACDRLESLYPNEDVSGHIMEHTMPKRMLIWEKSDIMVQLPEGFKTKIHFRNRTKLDHQPDQAIISPYVATCAVQLQEDIARLTTAWKASLEHYMKEEARFKEKINLQQEAYDNAHHKVCLKRVKKMRIKLHTISSTPHHLLSPYLYDATVINEEEKKHQVPTPDDLLHIAYQGVSADELCRWKTPTQQLICYFQPMAGQDDSRASAWVYACIACPNSLFPSLSYLFAEEGLLALPPGEATVAAQEFGTEIYMQAILESPKNKPIMSESLNLLERSTRDKTERLIHQLNGYYAVALVRIHPKHRQHLPLDKKIESIFKNFLDLFQDNGHLKRERLKSAHIFIDKICYVLKAKDMHAIHTELVTLDTQYKTCLNIAPSSQRSVLYRIMHQLAGPGSPFGGLIQKTAPSATDRLLQESEAHIKEERRQKEDERQQKEEAQGREIEERRQKEAAFQKIKELEAKLEEKEKNQGTNTSIGFFTPPANQEALHDSASASASASASENMLMGNG